MKTNQRRDFLKLFGGAAAGLAIAPFFNTAFAKELQQRTTLLEGMSPLEVAGNEDFWTFIQQSYTASPTIINLNNGGVSPQPKVVQDAQDRFTRMSNEAPSYHMWRILDKGREPIRDALAELSECSPEEIAINRNTTEALETIVFGLNLNAGDEVIVSNFDYPNMMNAWKQREKRDGIVLKKVVLDVPMEDDKEIVKRFMDQVTSKTKIMHVTHLINWTGQILPAKKIIEAAHKKGVEVVLDGAHSFAHIDYSINDLDCDYYGTSLHKWLCAPFGTGFLFVKKEKIKNLWPLFPGDKPNSDDIRKFEVLGTRSFPAEQAIGNAVEFHKGIGILRKEDRLRYLKNYWMERLREVKNIKLYTSFQPPYACALATVGIQGKTANEIHEFLYKKYKIHTTTIDHEGVNGVRITPHVYTTIDQLDRLVKALKEFAG